MNTMRTSEVLDLAADEIQRRGWTQGDGWDWGLTGTGPLCLEGAIGAASGIRNALSGAAAYNTCAAASAVRDYLDMRPYNHEYVSVADADGPLYEWNDRVARTAEEVIEVLRAAAAVERTKEIYEDADQPLPVETPAEAVA